MGFVCVAYCFWVVEWGWGVKGGMRAGAYGGRMGGAEAPASPVAGVHTEFQRVAADKVAGNTIGPFLVGQVVTLGTDVGNSRDFSELGPEQTVTVGPPV